MNFLEVGECLKGQSILVVADNYATFAKLVREDAARLGIQCTPKVVSNHVKYPTRPVPTVYIWYYRRIHDILAADTGGFERCLVAPPIGEEDLNA